jgi:hypothetical protein
VWLLLIRHVCPDFNLQKDLFGYCRSCERYMMYTDYDDDYDWDEFFLLDLRMKFLTSLVLFFHYLPLKLNFSPIS